VSSAQSSAAAFAEKAGIEVTDVPFRGGGERTVALAGGHIDADFDILAPLKTMREAKKVRVLGVAADHRIPEYSDIPTMKEGGVDLSIRPGMACSRPKARLPPCWRASTEPSARLPPIPSFRAACVICCSACVISTPRSSRRFLRKTTRSTTT